MKSGEGEKTCSMCGRAGTFVPCSGCGAPLCQACARFELHGSGCGTVIPAYYCRACVTDPHINPNAPLRDPED